MIKIKNLIKKNVLNEGILDGITASFIIDSGISESSVSSGRKFMMLPRYSLWGFKQGVNRPNLMENANDLEILFGKYDFTEDDVYQIEGTMKETLKRICESKFKDGGTKLNINTIQPLRVLN